MQVCHLLINLTVIYLYLHKTLTRTSNKNIFSRYTPFEQILTRKHPKVKLFRSLQKMIKTFYRITLQIQIPIKCIINGIFAVGCPFLNLQTSKLIFLEYTTVF